MTPATPSLAAGAVARSSVVVGAGVVGAQAIGVVRELWLAGHIGLSGTLDALLVALGLTTLASGVITGGASGALVPPYLEARQTTGREDARRLSGAVVAWLALFGLGISVGIAALAPVLITVSGPGLSPENHAQATLYLRLLTPVMFVTVVTTMMKVICQAEDRFGSIALATIAGPAATVLTLLALWTPFQLNALVIGSILGSVATLAVYVWATARVDALPIPRLVRDPRLRAMLGHAGPVTLSGAILEFRGIADRAVATLLGPGAVSALRYAMVLIQPFSQIGPAWSAVIYPRLVHLTLGSVEGTLAAWADRTLRSVVAIFTPVAALTIAVAPVAVFFAYGRGAFTADALSLTAGTVAAYAPLIVTLMMLPVVVGSANARKRGGVLLVTGALNVILNVVLDVLFAFLFGAPGIALATSVAEVLVIAVFVLAMLRSDDAFDLRPFLRAIVLSVLAVAPAALVIGVITWSGNGPHDTLGAGIGLVVYGLVGVATSVAFGAWLGIPEAREIVAVASQRIQGMRRSDPSS